MSLLETLVLVTNGYRPTQDYSRFVTWVNILNDPEFVSEIYSHEQYDVFGFLPDGVEFRYEDVVQTIMDLFNTDPKKIALLYTPCGAYFINKRVIPLNMRIESIDQLQDYIFSNGLRSIKAENDIFIL